MKDEQDQNNPQLNIENSQSWSYIWKKLKYSVFDVLFVLLDNSQSQGSMFGLIFESGVDYMQMLAFPFNSVVVDVWNNNTLNGVTSFFNSFNVSSYLPGIDFSTFLIVLYLLIFLIIVVISDIVYVAYSFSKKKFKFTFPLIFMAKVVPIIVTVMFLPIMQTLLNVVNCSNSQDGAYQVLQSFPDVVCWEGWHLFHTITTLIFSFLFVFISCIVALTLFEPRMTTNSLTARQNSAGQVVFIINKIVCQFIFSFSPFQGTLPYCLLLFALSCWLYYTYNVNQPYYNKNASKFFRICSTCYFWTNLMLLASQLLNSVGFQDGLVIWICGMIFIGITIIFQRKSNIDTLFSSSLKFKSGQQLQSHLQYVLKLHHNRNEDKNSYMLLLGYIQKHIQICLQEDCPLKYNKARFLTGKQEQQYSCKQLLKQIQRMFAYGIKKYPSCTKLGLTFAFFYMQKYEDSAKAYQHFTKALTTQPSFGEQFIIYRFKKIINEKLEQQTENKQDDLIELIRFDNHVALCQQGMHISGQLHKQFWIQLRQESPNLQRLNLIGARIIQTRQMVKENYKQIIKLSNDGLFIMQLQYNYALYLLYIAHETIKGSKLLEKVKRKYEKQKRKYENIVKPQKQNKLKQITNTKKGLVVVELNQQNGTDPCCRILKVNKQFLEIGKYNEDELIDKRLDKILPKMLEDFHDVKVREWLQFEEKERKRQSMGIPNVETQIIQQKKKNDYVGCPLSGYLKQSNGHVKRIKYQVYFIPLQSKFITQVKNYAHSDSICTILCDPEGIINEISQTTLYRFPITLETLQIQRLIGFGVIDRLRNSQNDSISVQLQSKDHSKRQTKYYQCVLKRLQVQINSTPSGQRINFYQTMNQNSHTVRKNQHNSYAGIIVTITQKRQSLGGISMRYYHQLVNRNKQQGQFVQTKRTSNFLKITNLIQDIYNQQQKSSKISSSGHSGLQQQTQNDPQSKQRKVNIDYQKYLDQNGKIVGIKTYRYYNEQIVRLYNDNLLQQESNYDFQEKTADLESKLSKQKMENENYQQRIKKSLNTYIWHPQIYSLFSKSIVLYIIFLAINIFIYNHVRDQTITASINKLEQEKSNLNQLKLLTLSLSETLYSIKIKQSTYNQMKDLRINFKSRLQQQQNIITDYMIQNGRRISIDLTNTLVRIQANILRFYSLLQAKQKNPELIINQNLQQNLGTIYYSYLTRVSEYLFKNYSKRQPFCQQFYIQNWFALTSSLLSFIFICLWIYESLAIKHKIFQILIWFLDIPFDYINFAKKQCVYFNRNYIQFSKNNDSSNRQFIQYDLVVQQYGVKSKSKLNQTTNSGKKNKLSNNQSQNYTSNEESQQNFQNRQLLITRYRKIGLLSRFTVKEMIKFIIFFIINCNWIILLQIDSKEEKRMQLVTQIIDIQVMSIMELNKLSLIKKIISEKESSNKNQEESWTNFKKKSLHQMTQDCYVKIAEIDQKLISLQKSILSSNMQQETNIFQLLSQSQESDLCQVTNNQKIGYQTEYNITQCYKLLNGRLKGGYKFIRLYIKSWSEKNSSAIYLNSQQQIRQFQTSLRVYGIPKVVQIVNQLIQLKIAQINRLKLIIGVIFYISIVSLTLLFIFPWNLYLRRLNIKINQTIQILNIIPMVLMPVYRKQTRQFIKWILLKASQENSDQQEQ